ncbi:hydantoinase/oxoprolinase family protein [Svornostia abyssi]|uniref:Hydantoinase/oxoprolinase family protein n=1 Tax=Svornostia abyssi TaxID=2898438 RepID=A0ABY5PFK1_9ACTN|nr:hydantoinase/oxoprolinase family protein [Parviterribacteraceae bacterium J379]
MLLGVDVGGTFTDAVLADAGRIVTAKASSTPDDQSRGVLDAVRAVLARAGVDARDITRFAHGMTVSTNALLEGHAARTVLVATEGFTDVVELGRQARPDLYRLCVARPAPIVPAERRVAASERMGPDGVLRALQDPDGVAAEVAAHAPESVAVVFLHADRHPAHERAIGQALRARLPGVHVSLSHEVVGTFREYERAATTEIDAGLSPLLAAYLTRLARRTEDAGLPPVRIMQSSGGLTDAGRAAEHAALTVLSGPAGGAAAAALLAARGEHPDLLCFDMGGTSCDVCVVEGGEARQTAGREIAGRTIALPMVDIHTVGAGGGSIGWRDPGGALRVGPRSAGAVPGPACYGRGGTEPAVTDANVVLGRIGGTELAGGLTLDRAAAEAAVDALAAQVGLDRIACAEGIVRVANAEMVRALRVMTVERGVDPRRFALLAFGGAGPLHACALAEELDMTTVLVPRAGGVLSALGLAAADRRATEQRTVMLRGDALTDAALREVADDLAGRARAALGEDDADVREVFAARYAGQAHELTVGPLETPGAAALRAAFDAVHEERYGFADPDAVLELVTVRATAVVPGPPVDLAAGAGAEPPQRTSRRVVFDGAAHDAEVLAGDLPPGLELAGPAVCELREATVVVPPGWRGHVDAAGTLALRRETAAP